MGIRMIIPGHAGINGYRVVVDPMLRDGYAFLHTERVVLFALSTARSMCRRLRRRLAREGGRRFARAVAAPSFAAALDSALARSAKP